MGYICRARFSVMKFLPNQNLLDVPRNSCGTGDSYWINANPKSKPYLRQYWPRLRVGSCTSQEETRIREKAGCLLNIWGVWPRIAPVCPGLPRFTPDCPRLPRIAQDCHVCLTLDRFPRRSLERMASSLVTLAACLAHPPSSADR